MKMEMQGWPQYKNVKYGDSRALAGEGKLVIKQRWLQPLVMS